VITPRVRIAGAIFVVTALAAQIYWMGRAAAVLSVGLIIAYFLWVAGRWKNDSASVLPIYLLSVAVQCLHFTEEYVTGFQRQFPKLIGYEWSDTRFVTFNLAWLAVFVLAGLGVYWRMQMAYALLMDRFQPWHYKKINLAAVRLKQQHLVFNWLSEFKELVSLISFLDNALFRNL